MNVTTNFRNAVYDASGTITCEIEHPIFGWIPFTASATDVEPHGRALFAHMATVGPVAAYVEPEPEVTP